MATLIAGFSPQDKVPGAYGQIVYGVSGLSAASAPLLLLLVGLALSSGTITPDTQVVQVFDKPTIDTYAGAGGELAGMGYDALDSASDVPTFIASPTPANGGVQAGATIAASGTATANGSVTLRAGGRSLTLPVFNGDTASAFATRAAGLINGADAGRYQVSATASSGNTILTWKTPGTRGNQAICFLDTTTAPAGISFTITGNNWVTATAYPVGTYIIPTSAHATGYYYKATAVAGTGTSGASEPTWPTTVGTTVVDNSGPNQITWTCWGQIVTGGGVQLGGGSGLETYTNLLATIASSQYDSIAIAANDSTSLAAWKAQTDSQMLAPQNILQMGCVALNGTLSAALTINSGGTLNDQIWQLLWCLNSETHPSRLAAGFMAQRTHAEATDPDAAYNWVSLVKAAPMSQKADWPSHSTLVSALNGGVTPLTTTGDGTLKCVRSITSHCLLSGNSDYSTLDTGQARVPQFILRDLRLYWTTVVAPNNPRVQDDPGPNDRKPPQGVIYPRMWSSLVFGKLQNYAKGILSGTSATVAPIIINPVPPTSSLAGSSSSKYIASTVNVTPAPNNATVTISVMQG